MKPAIKHNLLLLVKRQGHPMFYVWIFFFILFGRLFDNTFFLLAIPTATALLVLEYENAYKIIFSLPITRKEFAEAKLLTLLIVYGATTLFTLAVNIFFGTLKVLDSSILLIELFITLPLSIIFGGIVIRFSGAIPMIVIFVLNFIIIYMNIDLHMIQYKISDVLAMTIWLLLSIVLYIGIRKSIINMYMKMEL